MNPETPTSTHDKPLDTYVWEKQKHMEPHTVMPGEIATRQGAGRTLAQHIAGSVACRNRSSIAKRHIVMPGEIATRQRAGLTLTQHKVGSVA